MAKRHVFQSIGCSAALLLLTSISAADDTGIKDGSFESGTSGVWKQTGYVNQSYVFETEVRDETCGEVPRQAYLHLELDLPCSSCFIRDSGSPKLWQDDIQLGACDIGEHAILRFDHRILSSVSFVALDVTIEARSKDQNEVVSASRSLLSIGEDSREDFSNCAWSTDEVTLDISALSALEASTFKIIFKLRPWGVCGGPEYATVDLDQIELFVGTPGESPVEIDPPCGDPFGAALQVNVIESAVETFTIDSTQPARDYRRTVEAANETCVKVSGGFGNDDFLCLEAWEVQPQPFDPAIRHCDEASCPGDLSGNGLVNGEDLVRILGTWGACPGCPEDLNGDGMVNGADLVVILGTWGPCS